ncbi:MAG: hypothetical protein A2138_19685 [Deltaproteobacteria bacterium RBG_16_71_12]|nr:MAG: hypothetical protein A2138_19685 [Deltaproteobacteria bacterium RBG_16_71_12]
MVMIESAHFQKYRALRDVAVSFAPLTAFVGPNASGKSSVLHAFAFARPLEASDAWRHEATDTAVSVTPNGRQTFMRKIGSAGSPLKVQLLRLDPARMKAPIAVVAASSVAEDGSNLPNVYASLSKQDRVAVADQFRRLVPVFGDVDVRPSTHAGNHGFVFEDRWATRVTYAAGDVSDGALLVLGYLIAAFQHPPADVVAVEEPERGLHPYLLEQLIALFRKMTTGLGDRAPIQVIVATHSPDVLDHLRPEEVRFMDRDASDGSVSITAPPTTSPEWEAAFREYRESMGEAWLSGALGGVPGAGP